MNTRTAFELSRTGVVRCNCGCVVDFSEDLNKYIVPMLASTIDAEFNGKRITVSCYDNKETILQKFYHAMKC